MSVNPDLLTSSSANAGQVFTPGFEWMESESLRRLELLEKEHRQRMEYARIEHERRMQLIEDEADWIDQKCRRLAEEITPSNDRLMAMAGQFTAPPHEFDDEEMPC